MKEALLIIQDGAKFSPAAVFLAGLLRKLKSSCETKDDFIRHMSTRIGDKQFTKAEVLRLWDALHTVTYYYNEAEYTGMDRHNKLTFVRPMYAGFSIFFERYAKDLLELGNIVQHRGRKKGVVYPKTVKPSEPEKLEEVVIEEPIVEEIVEEAIIPLVPQEKTVSDFTTEELVKELSLRGYLVNLCYNGLKWLLWTFSVILIAAWLLRLNASAAVKRHSNFACILLLRFGVKDLIGMIWYKCKTTDCVGAPSRFIYKLFDSFEEAVKWERLVNEDPYSSSTTVIGPATQQEVLEHISSWSVSPSERLMGLINDPNNYAK